MPFGIDNGYYNHLDPDQEPQPIKQYIDVIAKTTPDGKIIPLKFIWTDGREYNVGKVLDIWKGHSRKVFSLGLMYKCQTGKKKFELHYDGERWYVEIKPM